MIEEIAQLLNDREHGASWIQERLIDTLIRYGHELSSDTLHEISEAIRENFPAMVQMHHLASELSRIENDIPERLRETKEKFAGYHEEAHRKCVRILKRRQPKKIATISFSSHVIRALIAYRKSGAIFSVTIGEGNPAREGQLAAEILRENGIRTYICKDENLARLSRKKDLIMIGSDAIGEEWLINKAGSYELVIYGALSKVPTLVCSSRDKVVIPHVMNFRYDTDFLREFKDEITAMHLEVVPTSIIWKIVT